MPDVTSQSITSLNPCEVIASMHRMKLEYSQIHLHPMTYSIVENIHGKDQLPHEAIHTELFSPFTDVYDPLFVFLEHSAAWFTPQEKVLCIQCTGRHFRSTATIEINHLEGSSCRECELPTFFFGTIRTEDIRMFRVDSKPFRTCRQHVTRRPMV